MNHRCCLLALFTLGILCAAALLPAYALDAGTNPCKECIQLKADVRQLQQRNQQLSIQLQQLQQKNQQLESRLLKVETYVRARNSAPHILNP